MKLRGWDSDPSNPPYTCSFFCLLPLQEENLVASLSLGGLGEPLVPLAAGKRDRSHQEPSAAGSAWPAGPGLHGKAGYEQLLLL